MTRRTAALHQEAQEKPVPLPTGAQLLLPDNPTHDAALISRVTCLPLHWGQHTSSSSPAKTSLSKQLSHASHRYSYIGIDPSGKIRFFCSYRSCFVQKVTQNSIDIQATDPESIGFAHSRNRPERILLLQIRFRYLFYRSIHTGAQSFWYRFFRPSCEG